MTMYAAFVVDNAMVDCKIERQLTGAWDNVKRTSTGAWDNVNTHPIVDRHLSRSLA